MRKNTTPPDADPSSALAQSMLYGLLCLGLSLPFLLPLPGRTHPQGESYPILKTVLPIVDSDSYSVILPESLESGYRLRLRPIESSEIHKKPFTLGGYLGSSKNLDNWVLEAFLPSVPTAPTFVVGQTHLECFMRVKMAPPPYCDDPSLRVVPSPDVPRSSEHIYRLESRPLERIYPFPNWHITQKSTQKGNNDHFYFILQAPPSNSQKNSQD